MAVGILNGEFGATFDLEKVMNITPQRMDILYADPGYPIEIDASVIDAILALRQWEHLARTQLASAAGPGQLFSPRQRF